MKRSARFCLDAFAWLAWLQDEPGAATARARVWSSSDRYRSKSRRRRVLLKYRRSSCGESVRRVMRGGRLYDAKHCARTLTRRD